MWEERKEMYESVLLTRQSTFQGILYLQRALELYNCTWKGPELQASWNKDEETVAQELALHVLVQYTGTGLGPSA